MPATSEVAEPGSGATATPAGLLPRLRSRRVFPGEPDQLAMVRHWLASLLPPCPARDDVVTVASELATNAVVHTFSGLDGWFSVEVSWYGPVVRVAVVDGGGQAEPRVIEAPAGKHGRGLLVVRELALRTGICGDHRGRLVWADISWQDDPAAAATALPRDTGWPAMAGRA